MATIHVIIPDAGTVNWSGAGAIGATDIVSLEQTGGNNNGTFVFDVAAVTCGGIIVQDGKNITIRATNNGTVNINGSWVNLWKLDLTGTSIIKLDASIAAADCLVTWQSRTGLVGYTLAAGTKIWYFGTPTYRILHSEAGSMAGTAHFPTWSSLAYPVPSAGGTIEATYTYLYSMQRLHGKTVGEALTLTDAAYFFYVATEPEEEIVAGTITMTRAIIGTWQNKAWYIKPTGTLTVARAWFDNLLPSFYSTNYYVVLLNRTTKAQVKFRAPETVQDSFLGSDGSYIEITNRKSSYVVIQGSARYGSVWDHPLSQRKFLAQLMDLKQASAELVKFTWHEGHFPKAYLIDHDDDIATGRTFYEGNYDFKFEVIEAPYN